MPFFMFWCDNHLKAINKLPEQFWKRIEKFEHDVNTISCLEDFDDIKVQLCQLIDDICNLKVTSKKVLEFLGGLTMIEKNMQWCDGKALYIDINDANEIFPSK